MIRRTTLLCAMAAMLVAFSACSPTNGETRAEPAADEPAPTAAAPAIAPAGMMTSLRNNCPMAAEAVDVEVSDTDMGVAIAFTTDTNDVADLRRRVQHMAEMYGTQGGHRAMMWQHHKGRGMGQGHGPGQGRMHRKGVGMGMMQGRGPMPPADARVEAVEKGARIILTPRAASKLDALREHVRMHRERMHSGECWMLEDAGSQSSIESEG